VSRVSTPVTTIIDSMKARVEWLPQDCVEIRDECDGWERGGHKLYIVDRIPVTSYLVYESSLEGPIGVMTC